MKLQESEEEKKMRNIKINILEGKLNYKHSTQKGTDQGAAREGEGLFADQYLRL